MAYVNVAEWSTDQVCEWLKGLENSVLPYVHSFTNNKVSGQQLLNLRPEDLEQLGVFKFGHQEIILEAVESLRHFHYELDRENLQLLALRLSCQAHSLHNELSRQNDSKPVTTQTLSDVVAVVTTVKPLVRWLDRPPFSGQLEYNDKKTELLKLSIEMATCAQRDRFAEKPIEEIRETCGELATLADYIIQDISDPMILQPASLDLATLKKRPGDDLGFYILPSFNGTHQIADIKFGSAAHQCGKMEEGDEIVQVNYQTVVGWERKNVLELLNESPTEVLLTLKRRPRHTKIYGQIYIKPYRLPSNKKTTYTTRWQHNLPSPRPELLTIPDFTMPLPRHTPKDPSPEPASIIDTVNMLDTMATDESSDSDSEVEAPLSVRLYASKPRSLVQRRATITGASPTTKHAVDIEQFWKVLKQERNTTFQLRDKAASCAHGLDNVPSNIRPQTCLGIEQSTNKRKKKQTGESSTSDEKKVQFNEKLCQLELNNGIGDINLNKINQEKLNDTVVSNIQSNNINNNNNVNSDNVVPSIKCKDMSNSNTVNDESVGFNDIGSNCRKDRGKLDKSHSTPAYDFTDDTTEHNIIDINYQVNYNNNKNNNVENLKTPDTNLTSINILNKTDDTVNNIEDHNCKAQNNKSIDKNFVETDKNEYITGGNEAVPEMKIETIESIDDKRHDELNNLLNGIGSNINDISELIVNNDNNSNIENSMSDGIYKFSDNSTISRESSEEKSESTSSYMEGIYNSSSSETETPLKIKSESMILRNNINETLTPLSASPSPSLIYNNNNNNNINNNKKCLKTFDQLTDSKVPFDNLSTVNKITDNKNLTPQLPEKTTETKLRQTPPEPPPRKYFTKPSPLNINLIYSVCDYRDKPKVPDRKDVIAKKDSIFNDKRSNSETIVPYHHNKTPASNFEGYRDFIEKSNDFIDDTNPPISEQKSFGSNIDHFGYSEIYDRQLKDDKNSLDKYELFTEKFGGKSSPIISQSQPVIPSRTSDSPDGAGCSRIQSPEVKPRTLEKDKSYEKGVVNRAMMVARSIGLHSGGSKVSSGSPRSSRKRNILLAKHRDVSVKDISPGDLEGWLTYRSRGAGGAWARSWFVLKGSSLYRFKNLDSTKSDCLIALSGFTASSASEVKSRKYAFKVYHTGTVFYFAADNEDSLSLWLDSINKVTLGADSHNRSSGLFSETDESDTESKVKVKNNLTLDCKSNVEKTFGSLKKLGRKDSGTKDHDSAGGASLDRKYLKFLGARPQNVPVPTAQFRSYRRVLPSSTPNKKQEPTANSPDLHVTVAGSTFYGLSSSQSATDVPSTSQDMGDYRQSIERSQSSRGRRTKDGRGFITLEEFMLSHQNENLLYSNRSTSPRTARGYHNEHEDNNVNVIYGQNHSFNGFPTNGMIYGNPRNGQIDEMPTTPNRSAYGHHQRNVEEEYSARRMPSPLLRKPVETNEFSYGHNKRAQEGVVYYPPKYNDSNNWHQSATATRDQKMMMVNQGRQDSRNKVIELNHSRDKNIAAPSVPYRNDDNISNGLKERSLLLKECNKNDFISISQPSRRYVRDNSYSGSSGDLSCCSSSETFQRVKKETAISRKGSFNFNDRKRDVLSNEKSWMDSLRRSDKKINIEKARLKCAAQYQPSPLPTTSFENDGMKAAFEMHLDKNDTVQQKTSKFKSLFGSKSPQKPTLDLPKESQKTLLGSPRLHRALFRDKNINNQRQIGKINGQSPSDSGISHSFSSYSGISQSHPYNSQSFSSASSVSEWSLDAPTLTQAECTTCQQSCQKRPSNASINLLPPPTLPYIPPPTSPPPDDYPGLEYPPVFEPGTYSLSDASILRNRGKITPKDVSD